MGILFLSTLITILEIKTKFKYVFNNLLKIIVVNPLHVDINSILFVNWYLKIEKELTIEHWIFKKISG